MSEWVDYDGGSVPVMRYDGLRRNKLHTVAYGELAVDDM